MVDMSIIDENDIDVAALQKELKELRKENRILQQENARLEVWKNLTTEWMHDIDNLYHMIYGEDTGENCHDKILKIINMFSTKKGRILLKFLT